MVINKKQSDTQSIGYNKWAIISLIFSIVSIIGFSTLGTLGFLAGIAALNQIKRTREKGKGLAITAIITGFIFGVIVLILKVSQ